MSDEKFLKASDFIGEPISPIESIPPISGIGKYAIHASSPGAPESEYEEEDVVYDKWSHDNLPPSESLLHCANIATSSLGDKPCRIWVVAIPLGFRADSFHIVANALAKGLPKGDGKPWKMHPVEKKDFYVSDVAALYGDPITEADAQNLEEVVADFAKCTGYTCVIDTSDLQLPTIRHSKDCVNVEAEDDGAGDF